MAADLDALRGKVQRMLTERLGTVQVDRDGDFTIRHGSAQVFVLCRAVDDSFTYISVEAPLLRGVPKSPEFFERIAMGNAFRFGSLTCWENSEDPSTVNVVFGHRLLADYLDAEELMASLAAVAGSSDQLDDELQQQFGGQRFHEDG